MISLTPQGRRSIRGRSTSFTGPAALHHNLIVVGLGMFTRDRTVPPGLDLSADVFVEVRDRGLAQPCPPHGLNDVIHTPERHSGQLYFDQRI